MKFTKEDTLKVKGVAILIMLLYHLFGLPYNFINYDVQFIFLNTEHAIEIAQVGNVCVSIFAFLSAYGITKKINGMKSVKEISKNSIMQYGNLLKTFIPIFITSLLMFSHWISIRGTYGEGIGRYIYMILDFFGLSNLFGGAIYNPTWWYMTLAILIIFITPLFLAMYDRVGILLMPIMALLPLFFETNFMIAQYSLIVTCGICFAKENYLEKVKEFRFIENKYINKSVKFVVLVVGMFMFSVLKQSLTVPIKTTYYAEQILAILVICFVYEFLTDIKIVSLILNFLGKHSANIYFTHTFFIIWVTPIKDFIFQLKYAPIIFFVTLGICLIYSFLLEQLKKVVKRVQTLIYGNKKLLS